MKLSMIRKNAGRCLKRNLSKAVSLVMLTLLCGAFVIVLEQICISFVDTVAVRDTAWFGFSRNVIVATIFTITISALFISPLLLSLKWWYIKLGSCNPPVSEALRIFKTAKSYIRAVWFCIVKGATLTISFILLQVPFVFLAAIFKSQLNHSNQVLSVLFLILFVSMVVCVLFAAFAFLYLVINLFYADYIYLCDEKCGAVSALLLSIRVARNNRKALILMFLSLIPVAISCILIIPALFAVPYIKSVMAIFAKGQLDLLAEPNA